MKELFKRWLPPISTIKSHPKLQFFGKLLHDPNLWHINRHSLSGGMAVGIFCALVPLPIQMLLSAGLAILFRVNLPLAISLTWVTNPFTMAPIVYCSYKVGAFLLGIPPVHISFTSEGLAEIAKHSWQPFLLGTLVLAVVMAILSYFIIQLIWRFHIGRSWQKRREKRLLLSAATEPGQQNLTDPAKKKSY